MTKALSTFYDLVMPELPGCTTAMVDLQLVRMARDFCERTRAWRGDFDAIVSAELFDRVQAVLDGKAVVVAPHLRNHPDFPLRVFVRCESCATGLTGSWSKGRTSRYPYYRCRSTACKAVNIRKSDLENSFVAYLSAMTPKQEFVRLFRAIMLDVWKKKQAESRGARQRLQRKLESLIAKKDRVVDAFLHRGVLDQRTYERQRDILDEEITLTESALHDARLDELDVEGLLVFAEYLLSNAGRLWMEASLEQKQRLQNVLFPRGVTWSRDGGCGTAETSIIFRLLRVVPSPEASVVSFDVASWNQLVTPIRPSSRRVRRDWSPSLRQRLEAKGSAQTDGSNGDSKPRDPASVRPELRSSPTRLGSNTQD